jgi:hypothetical protein
MGDETVIRQEFDEEVMHEGQISAWRVTEETASKAHPRFMTSTPCKLPVQERMADVVIGPCSQQRPHGWNLIHKLPLVIQCEQYLASKVSSPVLTVTHT